MDLTIQIEVCSLWWKNDSFMKKYNIHIFKIFFIINFFYINLQTHAQIKKIHSEGTAFITEDISLNQAKTKALEEAKLNALKKAGITENIKSFETLYTNYTDKSLKTFFSNAVQYEMQGAIVSYNILEEKKQINKNNILEEYYIKIEADVIIYHEKLDPYFNIEVNGIKPIYIVNEELAFTFKITQDAYLHIFSIDEKEVNIIYPNNYDSLQLFTKEVWYPFPLKKTYKTVLTLQNEKVEQNKLLFIFTKQKYPLPEKIRQANNIQLEQVLQWLYKLSPNERAVYFNDFWVKQ